MKKMKPGKAIVFGVLLSLAFIAFISIASASTIYVPDDYSTIQAAVNAASPDDTIIVRDGTYTEHVKVDKKRLKIRSENGPDSTIVLSENLDAPVFGVTADYVEISGFTVKGATGWSGIHLQDYADHCNISNNNCSNNDGGIYLWYSNNNSISNNKCSNNKNSGINLIESNNNSISNNNCTNNNDWAGIGLSFSNNNKLKGNVMVGNGVSIWGGSLNEYTHEIDESNTVNGKPVYYWKNIEGGRIPDDAGQVILVNCENVVVENLNLTNASVGMKVAFSSYITIKNNNCSNNGFGILFDHSNNSSISNNKYSNNRYDGIVLGDSNNNHIYLNSFINNANNVYSGGSTNIWNSPEKITYAYGRRTYTSCLGNYWSDYTGTDRNRDGIGDTPYQIDGDRDMYPLMEPGEKYFAPSEPEIAPSERQSKIIYFILRWIMED